MNSLYFGRQSVVRPLRGLLLPLSPRFAARWTSSAVTPYWRSSPISPPHAVRKSTRKNPGSRTTMYSHHTANPLTSVRTHPSP